MKKFNILILFMFMLTVLFACENINQPIILDLEDDPIDENLTEEINDIPIIIGDMTYFRRFDPNHFIYAEVHIFSTYEDAPNRISSSLSEIKAFYQEKAQALLDEFQIETDGHVSSIYKSDYTSLVHFTYTDKQSFFSDFDILKSIHANGNRQVSMELNTIGLHLDMSESLTYDALLAQSSPYNGFTFIPVSLDFEVLEMRGHGPHQETVLPTIVEHPGIIIKDYDTYLTYFPNNHYELTPDYFNTKVILYLSSGRSGSVSILSVQSVYVLHENKLEIAIETEQYSDLVTMDYIMFYIVISMDIALLPVEVDTISLYQYNHYLNGFLSEVPFDTRPRPE
jgi:hypothetical protein